MNSISAPEHLTELTALFFPAVNWIRDGRVLVVAFLPLANATYAILTLIVTATAAAPTAKVAVHILQTHDGEHLQ